MLLLGIGLGPVMPLLNLAMQNAIPYAQVGTAVANRQFFQQLGQAVGAAVFGVILTTTLTHQITEEMKPIMAQLPAQMRDAVAIDTASIRNSIGSEQAGDASPIKNVERKITEHQQQIVDQLTKLANGDASAKTTLLADSSLPQPLIDAINANAITPQSLAEWKVALDVQNATVIAQLNAIDQQIKPALQRAFASSIRQIYQEAIWLVVISFAVILILLPEIPLRKSNRDIPATIE
jgi:hypothetical protein